VRKIFGNARQNENTSPKQQDEQTEALRAIEERRRAELKSEMKPPDLNSWSPKYGDLQLTPDARAEYDLVQRPAPVLGRWWRLAPRTDVLRAAVAQPQAVVSLKAAAARSSRKLAMRC
jgi:hypothetical protein